MEKNTAPTIAAVATAITNNRLCILVAGSKIIFTAIRDDSIAGTTIFMTSVLIHVRCKPGSSLRWV
ncbi:hypothetical protein D3C75_1203660 [compost metagenome]